MMVIFISNNMIRSVKAITRVWRWPQNWQNAFFK